MNKKKALIISIIVLALSACSKQLTKTSTDAEPFPADSEVTVEKLSNISETELSAITKIKAGKTLQLTRIMEGGVCKNEKQGVLGEFKLYTNPEDVERIKKKQGPEIFSDFESQISGFSMRSLQQAINQLNFQGLSAQQDENTIKSQLTQELIDSFIKLIADDIAKFERETTLMIDVIPNSETMVIYLTDCETPHDH